MKSNIINSIIKMKSYDVGFTPIQIDINDKYSEHNIELIHERYVNPRRLDFRDLCLPTDDQEKNVNCSAYAVSGFCEIDHWKTNFEPKQFPADIIYKHSFEMFGNKVCFDSGISLIQAARSVIDLKITRYTEAKYIYPVTRKSLMFAIHKYCSCICSFQIFDYWFRPKNGRIVSSLFPKYIGGHAVLVCGYDNEGIYIHNSWGINWGHYGFALLPWHIVEENIHRILILK